jgi:replicative DNA helicase
LFALAADYMSSGFNVAVFTMEMPELEVMKRIDANLLRVPINDVPRIDKPKFIDEIEAVSERSRGRLKVREYYTGEGNVTLFKQQMEDWFGFDGFKPDVILVDYLGICTSAIPGMLSSGSYAHLKQISVELRALAQWSNTVLWTAMQLNRDGIRSGGSGGMADMSESIGVPMTADFILLLHRSPDLDAIGKVTFHQIKTRYADKTIAPTVTLKLDLACQRFDDDDDFVANLELQKAVTRSVKYNTKHEDELLEADTMAFMAEHFVKQQSATDDDIKV